MLLSAPMSAATLRVFGSAGAESQLTPPNAASPLNPGNVLRLARQTNVGDATTFLELVPASKRWKARIKVRGEASDRATERVEIGEGFVQVQVSERVDLTIGRVIEKWGTGYGWTPTAFVGPARNPTDPNDRRAANRGVDMLRADVFVRDTSLSVYVLRDRSVAARAYRLVRGTDVTLVARSDGRTGVSLSRVFGDALELHGEVARTHGSMTAVAGAQYTIAGASLVFELYHGGDGLSREAWDAFRLAPSNRTYAPLHMARDYAFARAQRPFGRADAEVIAIRSLRDGSTLVRATLSYKVHPRVSLYAIDTEFLGDTGSELSYVQVARVTTLGARVSF
jgi:hypothetical protein